MGSARWGCVMSRYIDAEALEKRRIDYIVDGYADSVDNMVEWGMAIIEAPSIDIVRCKECRHCLVGVATAQYSNGKQRIENLCEKHKWSVRADDYCSCGEREGE